MTKMCVYVLYGRLRAGLSDPFVYATFTSPLAVHNIKSFATAASISRCSSFDGWSSEDDEQVLVRRRRK